MKKTNTKKSTSVQKSPAPKKAAPAAKKTVPVKKSPTKKIVTPVSPAKTAPKTSKTPSYESRDGIKTLGILHFIGNIVSGGSLGIVLVLIYLLVKKESLTVDERETCYEIINFNLSYIIYSVISAFLVLIVVGLLLLPCVLAAWFIFLVIGFTKHLNGEKYTYPGVIRFIS
jgi:hypothetical protein